MWSAGAFLREQIAWLRAGGSCSDGMQVIPIYNRGSREESKNYVVLCDMPRQNSWSMWRHKPAFQCEGRVLFNGCHYIGAAITPDCTLQRLGQLYDHTFCPSMISSGTFMRNWAMCKKVLAESNFFLKHGWIHFLVFLLIPRYNHDRIIREFRRPRRRTGILCFVMEGYALIAVRRWILWAYVCLRTIMW